jgi:hypothetical protein
MGLEAIDDTQIRARPRCGNLLHPCNAPARSACHNTGMPLGTSIVGVAVLVPLFAADAGVVTPLPASGPPTKALTKGPPALPTPSGPPELDPSLIVAPRSGPTAPGERRFDLRPAKDGSGDLLYDGPGYTAHVRTDGSVRFDDKGARFNRGWSLIPFMPLPIPGNPSTLQGVAIDFLTRRKKAPPPKDAPSPRDAPDPPLPVHNMSRYRPDPREVCRPGDPCFWEGAPLPGLPGQFDATDEIMRFNGKDPYRYDKAVFLTGTRELRVGMAVRSLAASVRRASAELDATLVAVGCDEGRSRAERRAILKALRAELNGDTPAARAAVAKIDRFVDTHFDAPPDGGVVPCGVSR